MAEEKVVFQKDTLHVKDGGGLSLRFEIRNGAKEAVLGPREMRDLIAALAPKAIPDVTRVRHRCVVCGYEAASAQLTVMMDRLRRLANVLQLGAFMADYIMDGRPFQIENLREIAANFGKQIWELAQPTRDDNDDEEPADGEHRS